MLSGNEEAPFNTYFNFLMMKTGKTLLASGSGLIGSVILTALHEIIRKQVPKAPRLDLLGTQVLEKALAKTGRRRKRRFRKQKDLRNWAMVGDILSNALYYSWIYSPSRQRSWGKSLLLGTAAGLGAVLLPEPLHLNKKATNRSGKTKMMTVGLYLIGALAAAAVQNALKKEE